MARTTRAAAAAASSNKSSPVQEVGKVEVLEQAQTVAQPTSSRKAKRTQRKKLYQKTRRPRQLAALKRSHQESDLDPVAAKKELSKLKVELYRPRRKQNSRGQAQQLQELLRKQQAEIETLKKALQRQQEGGTAPTTVEEAAAAATATAVGAEGSGEPNGVSPTEIQEQLLMEVAQSSYEDEEAHAGAPPSATLEVAQILEATAAAAAAAEATQQQSEQMEGIETTTTTTTTTTAAAGTIAGTTGIMENNVEYPTLHPTVEAADELPATAALEATNEEGIIKQTIEAPASSSQEGEAAPGSGQVTPKLSGTPLKPTTAPEELFRGSSADSNAGTPRNVRRSPRKRTVKRRSFAGHSYAV